MSADPLFDQISASTLADMRKDVVQDNFFVEGAWQRLTRFYHAEDPFFGGTWMQEPFMYNRVNGGAYAPGSDVEVEQIQILAAMQFTPRAYKQDVPINMWVTEVINAGPAAAVSTYDTYMTNAVQAMSTDMNIDAYQHGQANSSTVTTNRTIFMNGIDEAVNDGVNPGYLGNVYTTYGGQLRNGNVGNVLNATPIWGGSSDGSTGPVSYSLLFGAYLNCVQDPDSGLCNKAMFQYIASRQEPKQRSAMEGNITSAEDTRIGLTGFRILNAIIHVDKLAPSTKYGQLLPSGLSQTTPGTLSNFTSPTYSGTQNAISGFPSNKTCSPGEPFFWLRLQDWRLRPARSPEYNHNFTPPIRTQNNPDLIVMFYKAGLTYYSPSPRDNSQIVGCGS
ncbi:MAG TPA: hypothetical protein VJQ82_02670 [Terriglobales bacterium]|nr:hypothetical protein [Terriglobales bacterium]